MTSKFDTVSQEADATHVRIPLAAFRPAFAALTELPYRQIASTLLTLTSQTTLLRESAVIVPPPKKPVAK